MRRKRTIYFNDARHYYLFVHEPPMRLEDAWAPIDEVAGTGVDTFIYGVARGDGLFYPSKKGLRFGADKDSFDMAAYWRVWENMQSLIDRDLDPLRVHLGKETQDVVLRGVRDGEDDLGTPDRRAHHVVGVAPRQAVGKVLGKEQVDAVVNRHDRWRRAQPWQHVVGRVEKVCAQPVQLERDGDVLAQAVAGRLVDDRDEVPREVAQRRLIGSAAQQQIGRLLVDPREMSDQVTDVGTDAVVVPLADIDSDLHRALRLAASGPSRDVSG